MSNATYSHKFYKELELLVFKMRGDIYLKDILAGFNNVWNDKEYMSNCNGITDFRGCNLHITMDDMKLLSSLEIKEHKAILTKWAIISDEPKSVATLMLYEMLINYYMAKIFPDWESAITYHGLNMPDLELE